MEVSKSKVLDGDKEGNTPAPVTLTGEAEWVQLKAALPLEVAGKVGDLASLSRIFADMPIELVCHELKELGFPLQERYDALRLLWIHSRGEAAKLLHVGDKVTWKHAREEIPLGAVGIVVGLISEKAKVKFESSPEDIWLLEVGALNKISEDAEGGSSIWLESIPVVNLIWDAFFDELPNFQNVKDNVSSLTLVSALQITVVCTIPTSFEASELKEFVEKFEEGGDYECFGVDYGRWQYDYLIFDTVNALTFSAAATFGFILYMFAGVSSDFYDVEPKVFEVWWRYSRWVILFGCGSLIYSIIKTFHAFMDVYAIKFPEYYLVERNSCPDSYEGVGSFGEYKWSEVLSQWGYAWNNITLVLNISIWSCCLLLSLSARAKYRAQRHLPDWPCLHGRWEKLKTGGCSALWVDCLRKGFYPSSASLRDETKIKRMSTGHASEDKRSGGQVQPVVAT